MSAVVLRTQLSGVARRPARLLLTGLAVLVASFVVGAAMLSQQITERTMLDRLSGTPEQVAFVVGDDSVPATGTDLARIRALPGVAEAVGRFDTGVQLGTGTGGEYLQLSADPGTGVLALAHAVSGRYPQARNEIAITRRTADRMGLAVGTVLHGRIAQDTPPVDLTITGVVEAQYDFGSQAYTLEDTVVALSPGGPTGRIEVRSADGTAAPELRDRIQQTVDAAPRTAPDGEQPQVPGVRTGAEVRTAEAQRALEQVQAVFVVVGVFIAVAAAAALLVVASTFRIVFAQRTRQLALLRAVGAGRGGIARALAVEGALTGLVAGVTGLLAAFAVGYGLPPLLDLLGVHILGPGTPPLAALAAVLVGAVMLTVGAVLAPAYTAARVAPLAALRTAQTETARRDIGVVRLVAGGLLAVAALGAALLVASRLPGRDPENYDPRPMLLGIVGSGVLAFGALMLLGPLVVRPLLWVVGWPLRRLGPVGRLAVGGIGGAPRRAAAISAVVALGVTLITGVLVGGASVQVLADRELAISAPADFEMTADSDPIPAAVADQLRSRPELAHTAGYRRLDELHIGTESNWDANDLDLSALPALGKIDVEAGSLADAGPGQAVLAGYVADVLGRHVGDQLTVTRGDKTVQVRVAAIVPGAAPLHSSLILDRTDLDRLGAPAGLTGLLADAAAPGEDGRTAGQQAMQAVAEAGRYHVVVLADMRDENEQVLVALLWTAIGLIGITVLIAVVGVGSTTALSVVERIRESGLLRAVGLSRAALAAMLTTESGLYGVLGATLGLLLGIPYAWLSVRALGVDAPPTVPVPALAGLFAALVVLTALAGVLPARRASKVSPVAALGSDE
ncbi:ABC transporter substrate-binding protein [Catellatospora sp. TT07R-123]|uniref:ABC transporter permease n=1 Tax=Catellatospora sp. TT07R-123 TaxID=2733863 RepID=UPI001B135037|nr:FtsX-like permease family protein [Catellatospora sp. TT07R-123]GHJ48264.1 ABC transporter substrate-binding protein [Catellatospora sp. TT07R-123]